MSYYMLKNGKDFIGVVTSGSFVREEPTNGWLLTSNENLGQFVSFNNTLYRDYWMQPVPNSSYEFFTVTITQITEEEYNSLKTAIENNEIIEDEEEEEPIIIEPPIEEEEEEDEILEFVRAAKIKEMSTACRQTIEAGFDLDIRGETKHFSLTTQDQLNLMSLSAMAQTQSLIPYHADGEETAFYTADEINLIAQTATELKIYNTTYYNALKGYISSLETIEEIGAIVYGTAIPEEYKTDVLKILE